MPEECHGCLRAGHRAGMAPAQPPLNCPAWTHLQSARLSRPAVPTHGRWLQRGLRSDVRQRPSRAQAAGFSGSRTECMGEDSEEGGRCSDSHQALPTGGQ